MHDMTNEATMVGVSEAAELLGCSVDTVKRLARSGALPAAMKMPGKTGAYLFRRSVVGKLAAKRQGQRAA